MPPESGMAGHSTAASEADGRVSEQEHHAVLTQSGICNNIQMTQQYILQKTNKFKQFRKK